MPDPTAQAPTSTDNNDRAPQDLKARAERATARSRIAEELAKNKDLDKDFVAAIKLLVNVESTRQPNSLYSRIIEFIKEQGGTIVDDFTLYKKFKVAKTDMNKVIYQGQNNGIWISGVEKGEDTEYCFVTEQAEMPEDYPGPIRKGGGKKVEENKEEENKEEQGEGDKRSSS